MAWNGSNGASAPNRKPTNGASANLKGAIAGLIVVLGAGAAFYFLKPASAPASKASAPQIANEDQISGKKALIPAPINNSTIANVGSESAEEVINESATTNAPARSNPEQEKKHKTVITKPVFDNPTDQALAILMSSNGATPTPPVPVGVLADEEFAKSLDTPIEILDTDTERIREIKERVIAVREEIKERIKNGESFANIIAEHQNTEMENFRFRREVMTELNDIVRSGDMDLAERYVSAANVYLRQLGAQEVKMPSKAVQNKMLKAKGVEF